MHLGQITDIGYGTQSHMKKKLPAFPLNYPQELTKKIVSKKELIYLIEQLNLAIKFAFITRNVFSYEKAV